MAREKQPEIMTPEARAQFVNVLKARPARKPGQDPRFEIMLIFQPGTDIQALKDAVKATAFAEFGEAEVRRLTELGKFRLPFKTAKDFEKPVEGVTEGCVVIQPWSLFIPETVYKSEAGFITVTNPQDFYSGCWCRVMVRPFAYDTDGNRGVSFNLGNVLRTRTDKPLGGRAPAEQQFKDVDVPVSSGPAAPAAGTGDKGFLD